MASFDRKTDWDAKVLCCSVSPDASSILIGTDGGNLQAYNLNTMQLQWEIQKAHNYSEWLVCFLAWIHTANGDRILSGGLDRTLRGWDPLNRAKPLWVIQVNGLVMMFVATFQ